CIDANQWRNNPSHAHPFSRDGRKDNHWHLLARPKTMA
ncbi:MAG: hypothetical protein ACI9RY_001398, partial [Reinekea sp.]